MALQNTLCLEMAGVVGILRSAMPVLWSDKPSETVEVGNRFTRPAGYQEVQTVTMYVDWETDMLLCVKCA